MLKGTIIVFQILNYISKHLKVRFRYVLYLYFRFASFHRSRVRCVTTLRALLDHRGLVDCGALRGPKVKRGLRERKANKGSDKRAREDK